MVIYDRNWEKCRMTSVCLHLFPENTFDSKSVFVLWSIVVSWKLLRPTHGLPPWKRWCAVDVPAGPTSVPHNPGCLCGKAPTLLCVAWSRDIVCSVRSGSWSCFALMCNWEYLHSCSTGSAVQALNRHHSQSFVPFAPNPANFCGLGVFSPTELFLLVACNVAIHLVHAKCNSVSFSEDWSTLVYTFPFWGLSAIFSTGDTLYFVSTVLWASSTVVRVPNLKKLVDLYESGCVSAWNVGDLLCGTPHHQHCVQPQWQSPPALVSHFVWTADFQLSTSRSLDSKHDVVPATCSSFEQILRLSPFGSVSMVERAATFSTSFHNEGSWEHERMYCELCQHILRQIRICHQFPTPEQNKILPSHQTTLVYEPKCCATMMCFFNDTQTRSLSQNSRSRVVCHCAPQLKLENVEPNGHNCGLWKNCQNCGTVHKECWLKQRRNLIMTSPNKKKLEKKLMHWLKKSQKTTRT